LADGGIVSATAGLFIDADNVDAEVITFAFDFLRERGLRVTVRRAYGGHERLGTVKDICTAHGVKSLANHGRGTTDALLIVDAMDLLHGPDFPSVVAIASADADFAPLAIRLREAGCTTLCFAHSAKSDGDALKLAYDEVHFVDARRAEPAPRKAPARRAAPARAVPPAPPQRQASEATPLERVLADVPGLKDGDVVELNTVVALLRKEKLLGKTASGPKFLAKHAPYLRLTPEAQPNKVLWVRRRS
jgi:uncharacterized LabA/DUF88 family protein